VRRGQVHREPAAKGAPASLAARLRSAWWPWLEPPVVVRGAVGAVVLVAVTWTLGLVAVLLPEWGPDPDRAVLDLVAEHRHEGLVGLARAVSGAASFTTAVLVGALVAMLARAQSGHWGLGKLIAVSAGGALAIVGAVKLSTLRARPDDALFDALSSAFPSGHAARAAVVLGLVTWLVVRRAPAPVRRAAWVVAVAGAGLVGASRVYLGMHWPSDVVGGWIVGAGWLAVVVSTLARTPGAADAAAGRRDRRRAGRGTGGAGTFRARRRRPLRTGGGRMRSFGRVLLVVVTVAVAVGLVPAPASADPRRPGGTFLDDDGTTHEGSIEALHARGVLLGCNPVGTLVCPNDGLNRGQVASLLARAFALPPATRSYFTDTAGVHADAIDRVAHAGITLGRADGTYGPGATLTRGQLATFLARALGLAPEPAGPHRFADIAGGAHAGSINALARAGIARGCAPGRFCPAAPVIRGQSASFLARAFGLAPQTPPRLTPDSSTLDWCRVALRLLLTFSNQDRQVLTDYRSWRLGPAQSPRIGPGALPLQLFTVSRFSGDLVVARWTRARGLELDLGTDRDALAVYPVLLSWGGTAWSCDANAG
jgi:membrane-associated phospholipid phosphatase